jgi:hypothetical protein
MAIRFRFDHANRPTPERVLMNGKLLLYCGILCLVSVPSTGCGKDIPAGSDVGSEFLNALAEDQWLEAAELVHPATAEFLRDAMLARYECSPEFLTFEQYRAMQPDLSHEAAERDYQELMSRWDEQESIPQRFPGTRDLVELRGLPLREFVARYLAGTRRLGGAEGVPAYYPAVVVGEVREEEWVNVLYRHSYELEEEDPSGEVGFYRPAPKIIRLRIDGAGQPWVAWGLQGPHATGQTLGPGVLPQFRPPACQTP